MENKRINILRDLNEYRFLYSTKKCDIYRCISISKSDCKSTLKKLKDNEEIFISSHSKKCRYSSFKLRKLRTAFNKTSNIFIIYIGEQNSGNLGCFESISSLFKRILSLFY